MTTPATPQELVIISELSGKAWRAADDLMPLDAGLLAQLKELDADPFMVTLPASRVGARSKNGALFGRDVNDAIVAQVNSKRPEGHYGHLTLEERTHKYQPPAVRWLAACMDAEGTVWVKGYVPPSRGDLREHLRVAMMTNAKVALSIYGTAGSGANGEVVDFNLETIDIADPERAGLPVAQVPLITANMSGGTSVTEPIVVEERQVLAEMAGVLGVNMGMVAETVRGLQGIVSEMSALLGTEPSKLAQVIAQMVTKLGVYEEDAKRRSVIAMMLGQDGNEAILKLPELVSTVVANMGPVASWPTTYDDLKTRVASIMETPDVKALAALVLKAKAGDPVRTVVSEQHQGDASSTSPADRARELAEGMGFRLK